jgi:hypothetical protein
MTAVRLAHVLGCVAALGLVASACGDSDDPNVRTGQARPFAPLYSELAAAHMAEDLLARVPLPAKTERVAQPPATAVRPLGPPGDRVFYAKSVERHAYWVSTERPRALLAWLAADGPAPKLEDSGYGGTSGRTEEWSETLEVPTATPLAGPLELNVAIVLAGRGRYAVRIDASVAWHRRRPATSLVPATARWLQVTVVEPGFRGLPREPSRPRRARRLTTSTAHTVRAVAHAVNELPLAEPAGPVPSCPAVSLDTMGSPKLILTFRKTGLGSSLARMTADGGYVCSRVGEATATITTAAEPQSLPLTDHLISISELERTSLVDHIEAALDNRLHLARR